MNDITHQAKKEKYLLPASKRGRFYMNQILITKLTPE